ncbi:class II lanthipeptide, LchA2/BrtA2 family [Pseudonocardia saturnea]
MDSRDIETGTDDILGRYDELELVELGAADAYGGTGWACAAASAASAAFCPTTKCTSKC